MGVKSIKIPEWYTLEKVSAPEDMGLPLFKRFTGNFFDRSILGITSFWKNKIFAEEYSRKNGLLQHISPGIKILFLITFLLLINFSRSLSSLLLLLVFSLLLAALSRIELKFYFKRLFIFIPIFTGFIALPSIFNLFVPGDPLVDIMEFGQNTYIGPVHIPDKIYITEQGVNGALIFITRVTTSVSFSILIILTTEFNSLLKALKIIKVPGVIISIIGMSYRYINLLVKEIENLYYAGKSRNMRKFGFRKGRKWAGSRISTLLRKSIKISDEVYSAMIARGYRGEGY